LTLVTITGLVVFLPPRSAVEGFQMLLCHVKPMLLYHVTPIDCLAKIRREGLKPHRPGEVWGVCDPSMTRGKRVVWLTADPHEWKHDRHLNKKWRNPDARLLTIVISWRVKKLCHYLLWFDPDKRKAYNCQNNLAAWYVHFGTIKPEHIIDGLGRSAPKERTA
jgi:hypothetical protein